MWEKRSGGHGHREARERLVEKKKKKLVEELVTGRKHCALQRGDKSERERESATVGERRRGRGGGHEPTCRLRQKTVASQRISEERRNFNDPETSPAGLEGRNATDTSLSL